MLAPSFSEQSHGYAEVVDANQPPNGMISLTMRLNGGVSGKRRKCSALRRGGSVRKREKFLMRKKEERIRMMKKLNGGKDDKSESAEDLPDDMIPGPLKDLAAFKVMKKRSSVTAGAGAKTKKALQAARESGDKEQEFALLLRLGELRLARRILDAKEVDINKPLKTDTLTPLHWAVRHGSPDMVHMLCHYGADLFALDSSYKNPTMVAVDKGKSDILRVLHDWGGVSKPEGRHALRR
mmetsp:Transcript_30992/g.99425  ORF Transcript_30992/g.99425 Transcript_30992/m.99425 type:complete len:238 (-) Transcript_30992:71-784(-)